MDEEMEMTTGSKEVESTVKITRKEFEDGSSEEMGDHFQHADRILPVFSIGYTWADNCGNGINIGGFWIFFI
jgi:hypothetical protein